MDELTKARAERFQDWMSVMVAIVALVTALAAWRGAVAANIAGFEDYYALTASLNAEEALTLSTASAIEHLTAFTQFAVNDELLTQLLNADDAEISETERAVLTAQLEEADRLAATNRNFFPGRYASKDGTYALPREVAELLAEAERRQDLAPQPHLDKSAKQDSKTFAFVQIIIGLSVALLCFTLAGAFHYNRKWLRWSSAALGVILLLASAGAVLYVELG
ncbi:MAG: hypothetical protein HY741_22570 [Chloroflexi bacterium]|nr:hypothetical protein [Chloroflexota bacterium]